MESIENQKVDYSWDIPYSAVLGETYAIFMKGMKDKKIMGNVCKSCNGVHFPAKPFCEKCFEACDEWVELDGAATLVTYAVCYIPMPHLPKPPSITGIINLGGSVLNFVHNISGIDVSDPSKVEEQLTVGMKLKPVWKDVREGDMFDIDYFEPA